MKETTHSPYLNSQEILDGVKALKEYIDKSAAIQASKTKKDLLADDNGAKIIFEVVFKSVPKNSRTFIHVINLPHHWRSEDCNIALFVKHRKPETEVQALQFERDRDLDLHNTRIHYQRLFHKKLDENIRKQITTISTKELATEFNSFKKIEQLAKSYDLFLADKVLMENKFYSLPRRLGRRFWVKEKKVPLMVRLDGEDLDKRFEHALKSEPFYVLGRSSTERIQVGIVSQSTRDIVQNIETFLKKLHTLYGDSVRLLRLRSDYGISLPIFADLDPFCPKVQMKKKKKKPKTIVGAFDLLPDGKKISVRSDGTVKVVKSKK